MSHQTPEITLLVRWSTSEQEQSPVLSRNGNGTSRSNNEQLKGY